MDRRGYLEIRSDRVEAQRSPVRVLKTEIEIEEIVLLRTVELLTAGIRIWRSEDCEGSLQGEVQHGF